MRNDMSDSIAQAVNRSWKKSNKDVNDFMHSYPDAFDFTDLHETNFLGKSSAYAAFHIVHNGHVVSIYYWKHHDEWFAKF